MLRQKPNHRLNGLGFALFACSVLGPTPGRAGPPTCTEPESIAWKIVGERRYPREVFTQGFEIHDGHWWLSGGGYGQSQLLHIPQPGRPSHAALHPRIFAEGLSRRGDEIWLLTWRAGLALVFNRDDLALKKQHRYDTQGWGLAWDARSNRFLMSDGSSRLHWREAATFTATGTLNIRRGAKPVPNLNELEIVGTHAFANVWLSDTIIRIDLSSGCVDGELDLRALWPKNERPADADVLNGIAFDANTQRLWVTGKRWGKAFALQLPDQTFK